MAKRPTSHGRAERLNKRSTAANNWLATRQQAQMVKEIAAATSLLEKSQLLAKWVLISGKQDLLTANGIGKGLQDAGISDVIGIATFLANPVEGMKGLQQLISSWIKLCLINERFETCPQDINFFLPEETKTPSLYIALQYYMSDYWATWRSAEEKSREIDADRRRIDVSCKMLASNSWLLLNPQWLKVPEFLSACIQLDKWFQRGLGAGNFPSAEEATRYLQSLKKG